MPMLVGVNTLGVDPRGGGGEAWYLRRLLAKMREVQPDTRFVIFTDPDNHESFDGWERECLDANPRYGLFGGADAALDRAAKKWGVDLVFTSLAAAPAKLSAPTVLYALDLRRFEPDYVRQYGREALNPKTARRICTQAAAIVAPSAFVQRKFLELLDVPLNHVIVTPLGVDPLFAQPHPCPVAPPFLLSVGSTRECKNIPRLREVFDQLKEELPHSLVVIGRPAEAEPDDWGPRVMRVEYCSAAHLAGFYQQCDVFIQASLYEGSGIAALEAMRSGAIVVTSRTGGIEEAVSDIPIFFNPDSTHSIIGAVRWALGETPEQHRNRAKFGRQLAGEFTWEKCAWKTLSAFKRI